MSEVEYVRSVKEKWDALLKSSEEVDGTAAALMVSIWATLHMDRLIEIAERKVKP